MPELPDVEAYRHALAARVVGDALEGVRIVGPSLLRSYDPTVAEVLGKRVTDVRRLGKRLVLVLEGELFFVLHLMIAGRLRWEARGAKVPARVGLAAFDFGRGTLLLTEASKKRRAGLWLARGEEALAEHDPGGIESLDASPDAFAVALRRESHTLKRALTDPRILSGIGNAYSDEILHAARLSPLARTQSLDDEAMAALHRATVDVLTRWRDRLIAELDGGFPKHVTAFREGMAVHGRYGEPCPTCGAPVQRIVRGENESDYCARCQTGGKLLRDRALSRLLREDWPKTLDELEARKRG